MNISLKSNDFRYINKNQLKNDSKGITLIALVLTIIVLLVLAGILISMISGENGILKKVVEAKAKMKDAGMEDKVKMALFTSMEDGRINLETLNAELKKLDSNMNTIESLPTNIQINGKYFNISSDGIITSFVLNEDEEDEEDGQNGQNEQNEVVIPDPDDATTAWTEIEVNDIDEDGNEINKKIKAATNGKVIVKVGDIINYNPTIDPDTGSVYTESKKPTVTADNSKTGNTNQQIYKVQGGLTWRLLGIENEKLKIMPTGNITSDGTNEQKLTLGTKGDFAKSSQAAQYSAGEINRICEIYGQGKYADGARSVQIDDLDKIIRFGKNTYGINTSIGEKKLNSYNNVVTFYWDGTSKPYYEYEHGETIETGNLSNDHNNKFVWLDGDEWKTSLKSTTATETSKEMIGTITSTYYNYTGSSYRQRINDNTYNLIFTGGNYWIGSSYAHTFTRYVFWGTRIMEDDVCHAFNLVDSAGGAASNSFGLRPVVYLKNDIKLTETTSGSGQWNIS